MALALVSACWIAAGCSGNTSDPAGGAGGAGGSGTTTGGAGGGGGGMSGTVGCLKMDMLPTSCPQPPVTYANVKPIFDARCVSICHNGNTPDPDHPGEKIWGLTDYSHVQDWYREVRDTVANCTMPPPDAGVPVTIEERRAILEFIRCGLPK